VIRASDLPRLSQQEIQFLNTIARKLAPDTPQNQTKSKPAIGAVKMESEAHPWRQPPDA